MVKFWFQNLDGKGWNIHACSTYLFHVNSYLFIVSICSFCCYTFFLPYLWFTGKCIISPNGTIISIFFDIFGIILCLMHYYALLCTINIFEANARVVAAWCEAEIFPKWRPRQWSFANKVDFYQVWLCKLWLKFVFSFHKRWHNITSWALFFNLYPSTPLLIFTDLNYPFDVLVLLNTVHQYMYVSTPYNVLYMNLWWRCTVSNQGVLTIFALVNVRQRSVKVSSVALQTKVCQ